MAQKDKSRPDCGSGLKDLGCCAVESVVSIDDRGQMVLPKEIREKAQICPGDKLVVITMEKNGKFCCLTLIKAQEFEGMVKNLLTPMLKDLPSREESR